MSEATVERADHGDARPAGAGRAMDAPPDPARFPVVLYDRDCGFCRWSLAGLLALDGERRLRPVALESEEANTLLAGMEQERRLASAHLVTADGRVFSGGDAVPPLLRELRGTAPLAAVAGLVPGLWRAGYNAIARRRGTIGRRLPRAAVERATRRIDAHG